MNEQTETITTDNAPGLLLALADQIESNPQARDAIAAGFRVIAAVMSQEPSDNMREALLRWLNKDGEAVPAATIASEDNPEAGAEPRKLTAEESNGVGQAMAAGQTAMGGADLVDTAGYPGEVL